MCVGNRYPESLLHAYILMSMKRIKEKTLEALYTAGMLVLLLSFTAGVTLFFCGYTVPAFILLAISVLGALAAGWAENRYLKQLAASAREGLHRAKKKSADKR